MPGIKFDTFGGMVPALDEQLLPDSQASYCENAWLYSGKLIGTHAPRQIHTCSSSAISKVFRIPNGIASNVLDSSWVEFQNPDTDMVRAPVVNDSYERYYFASSSMQPVYNTAARLQNGDPHFLLGIPAPGSAMTLSPSGGSSAVTVTRSYVFTYVSAYGEEGPPSPPVTATGKVDDTWGLTLPAVGSGDTDDRNLASRRIYRTITSSAGVATYFLVATINDLVTSSYNDTQSDATVAGNAQLESTLWTAPPSDLEGIIGMPNGMIAGFRENELWFAEPFRPHAWPATYTLAVEFPIVGLGVIGQTLIVCTEGQPTAAAGIHPSSISQSKLSAFEPCLSRGSIVSAPEGVYYASQNGLVLVGGGTVKNITKDLITKDRWQELAPVNTLRAARLGVGYYAFGATVSGGFETTAFEITAFAQQDNSGALSGILIDPANARVAFGVMTSSTMTTNVMNDPWSGEVFIIRDGEVLWLDVSDPNPTHEVYIWRTKKYQAPYRKNLSAMRAYFTVPANTLPLNPVRNTGLIQTVDADRYGVVRAYADGVHVATWELRVSGELLRLPSGFRNEFWQFEIEARVQIDSLHIADTVEGLRSV